jgi:hypothetical protein
MVFDVWLCLLPDQYMTYQYHRMDKTASIDVHAHAYSILECRNSRLVDLLSTRLILMSLFLWSSNETSQSEIDHS